MIKGLITNQKGAILAMTTGFMLVFTLFGVSTIYLSGMQNETSEKQIANTSAFWLAEAGVQKALWALNNTISWPGWTTDADGNKNFTGQIGTEGDCNVTISGLSGVNPMIISTGYTPTGLQLYDARIKVDLIANLDAFDYAAFGDKGVSIGENSLVDSYDSANGPYDDETNSNSNGDIGANEGDISLGNNVDIEGDASLGPGATLDPENKTTLEEEQINNISEPLDLPEVIVPDMTGWSGNPNGALEINGTTVLEQGNYAYNSVDMIGNGSTLVIRGGTVNIYTKGVSVRNQANIVIEEGARAVFYLDGDWYWYNRDGGDANNVSFNITNSPEVTDFIIWGTSNCDIIAINNSSNTEHPDFYGLIYAPSADITVKNNQSVFGSFIGETVNLNNNGEIHYDEALRRKFGDDKYVVKEWQEVY